MRKWRRRRDRRRHRDWLAGLERHSLGHLLLRLPPRAWKAIGFGFAIVLLAGFYLAMGFIKAYARHKILSD